MLTSMVQARLALPLSMVKVLQMEERPLIMFVHQLICLLDQTSVPKKDLPVQ